jgi:hypothetical protein
MTLMGARNTMSPIAHRIRRKRQRLTSNDPIETAPTTRTCTSPHFCFGAVPLGIYRFSLPIR